ncbi:hypothetical protein AVEN_177490-1 [Araneus ventricosus]|uniref:Uncharacterized protein n=1 Tax=Araneus ventricosus TaxID=182803 RepID=A0A4Y2D0I9_ARAVE|nr:hypothetical protein AVEN_177490-1 [Araneus ventricosus]
MYSGEVFSRFHSKMKGDARQATLDNISRRHRLSCEIKIIQIGDVVEAGGFLQVFSPQRMYSGELFFRFRSKMEGDVGQATLDGIFRRLKLSYEINSVEIGRVG